MNVFGKESNFLFFYKLTWNANLKKFFFSLLGGGGGGGGAKERGRVSVCA